MLNNFNFGYSKVKTPFFCLLTDDDYYLPSFVENAMNAFSLSADIKFSIMSAPTVDEKGNVLFDQLSTWPREGIYSPGEEIRIAVQGNQPIITTCIFRSELIPEMHYDEAAGPIADLPILIALLAKYSFHLSKSVGGYFVRHGQASGAAFSQVTNSVNICRAFLHVESTLQSNRTINDTIRRPICLVLQSRLDKLFLDLMVQSLARKHLDAAYALRVHICTRQSRSTWHMVGIMLCYLFDTLGFERLSTCCIVLRRIAHRTKAIWCLP